MTLRLSKKIFIKGKIVTITGLQIGGSSLGLSIGGADKVVVRDPLTNLPYIPGSSLKGKMRALVEKARGLVKIQSEDNEKGKKVYKGKLCDDVMEDVVQFFGFPAEADKMTYQFSAPTRLTVRDGHLLNKDMLEGAKNTDMYCTEIKTEVSIDRLTSAAKPRNFERVPAGAEFGLDLIVDIYSVDIEDDNRETGKTRAERFLDILKQGLMLIEEDYLGGQGTRGYGQVRFKIDEVLERTAEDYLTGDKGRLNEEFTEMFKSASV
jgi:CRISPR-associated protein Csm3